MMIPRKPSVEDFARIGGLEAMVRGGTLSVFPLVMYRAWGSAAVVSQIYFAIGLVSLFTALMVPALARRWHGAFHGAAFTCAPVVCIWRALFLACWAANSPRWRCCAA